MCPKDADRVANTVCPDLSVWKLMIITVTFQIQNSLSREFSLQKRNTDLVVAFLCGENTDWKSGKENQLGRVKRICVFEHSVMTNFNCTCPAMQRGQGSGVLSACSSWLTACMSEERRFWRDCADAHARLNLRCSHRRYVPNSLDAAQLSFSGSLQYHIWLSQWAGAQKILQKWCALSKDSSAYLSSRIIIRAFAGCSMDGQRRNASSCRQNTDQTARMGRLIWSESSVEEHVVGFAHFVGFAVP